MTKLFAKFKEKPQWFVLSLVFLLVAALSRFLLLDNKPIHFDESINMWFVQKIWEDGFFTYDPTNYHGPLLFYLIHFAQLFTGFDYLSTRWVATIFSFLTLVILWFGPFAQRQAFRWAAVFLLFSPAMGFYGRSGIHESAFVFFQVLGFLSFHYLVAKEFKKFWWSFVGSLLGMMALKETFVILILAVVPAILAGAFWERRSLNYKKWWRELTASFRQREVYFPLLAMLLVFLGVYSGFGSNPKGLVDFFVALMPWLKTGVQGNGHEKEFLHWSKLMGLYEYAIVAGFFLGALFLKKNKWIRFYMIFSFFLWLIYSLIPYKTPWCLISILWPLGVVAGLAVQELLVKVGSKRAAVFPVLGILFAAEAKGMYELMYRDPIDMGHQYVYVNSTYAMKEFIEKTQELLREQPLLRESKIQVGTDESWPIPIVFYKFYTLSYFKPSVKVEEDALIYMAEKKDQELVENQLKVSGQSEKYVRFPLAIRQSRAEIVVYVKKEFFENRFSWELEAL